MRSEEMSACASSASFCSSAVSSAGGAHVYVARCPEICRRNVARSNGWCWTSSGQVSERNGPSISASRFSGSVIAGMSPN